MDGPQLCGHDTGSETIAGAVRRCGGWFHTQIREQARAETAADPNNSRDAAWQACVGCERCPCQRGVMMVDTPRIILKGFPLAYLGVAE